MKPGTVRAFFFLAAVLLGCACASAQVQRGDPLPRRAALGAQLTPATPDEAKAAGVGRAVKVAAVVGTLTASSLKMEAGDLILSLNGQAVETPQQAAAAMRSLAGGDKATADVWRSGSRTTLTGTAVGRPKQKEDGFKVVYDQVVSRGRRVRVIFTHPEGKGPFPTLFVIGGIGVYTMDGDFPSVPYGNMLAALTKDGYATVRMDKPGMGDSEGPAYPDLLFDDELDAYLQSMKLAKEQPFVDAKRIAIFGHSMGGTFGPLVAAQEPVAGVAVNGTLSKTWVEYVAENTRRQSLLSGASAGQVDDAMRTVTALTHLVFGEGLSPAQVKEKHPRLAKDVDDMFPDGRTYSGVGIPFFQQLAQKNIMAAWEKHQGKALITYGENDFLSGQADHEFVAETLNRLRPGSARFVLLKNSDHGFNVTSSMKDSLGKWGRPGNTFNPSILEELRAWLKETLAPVQQAASR